MKLDLVMLSILLVEKLYEVKLVSTSHLWHAGPYGATNILRVCSLGTAQQGDLFAAHYSGTSCWPTGHCRALAWPVTGHADVAAPGGHFSGADSFARCGFAKEAHLQTRAVLRSPGHRLCAHGSGVYWHVGQRRSSCPQATLRTWWTAGAERER